MILILADRLADRPGRHISIFREQLSYASSLPTATAFLCRLSKPELPLAEAEEVQEERLYIEKEQSECSVQCSVQVCSAERCVQQVCGVVVIIIDISFRC